ncbi:hypothetical protein [Allonocardiopsis opalescens]|uniref:Uncharacterized protein n=1 Tax=Allonocardiopsis opalescens TaxID=1144618 RepID=A0A2T0Q2N9_9ACTN|nr:hypothetical protein [Allonocardiopsis opalescens]PRX98062.1 hypothetical protein CLV72_105415 [Allonocardiopsis opalescens]
MTEVRARWSAGRLGPAAAALLLAGGAAALAVTAPHPALLPAAAAVLAWTTGYGKSDAP